ncbi:MAG: hypothetical protein PVJ07_09940 [Anaerolineales bacterium]|jgi:hypothetical protein
MNAISVIEKTVTDVYCGELDFARKPRALRTEQARSGRRVLRTSFLWLGGLLVAAGTSLQSHAARSS